MGTVVVGLGGMGFKVVSLIKGRLLGMGRPLPPSIRLRSVDVEPLQAINAGVAYLHPDAVELSPGEHVCLSDNPPPMGADLAPLVWALAQGGLPTGVGDRVAPGDVRHLTSWFQASAHLNLLPRAGLRMSVASGQARQLARLALFWNVQSSSVSAFHHKMYSAIQQASGDGDVNVLLVSSTWGGTGSALLVDIAYLVRHMAGRIPILVTAFLILPEGFAGERLLEGQRLASARARSYACLREVARHSRGSMGHLHCLRITYNPQSLEPIYRDDLPLPTQLFDTVYHINGEAGREPPLRSARPEQGVLPLVVEGALALMRNSVAGRESRLVTLYVQALSRGLDAAPNDPPLERRWSSGAVGAYSIVLPIVQIVEALAQRQAQDVARLQVTPGANAGEWEPSRPNGSAGREGVDLFLSTATVTGYHSEPAARPPADAPQLIIGSSSTLFPDIRDLGTMYGNGADPHRRNATIASLTHRDSRMWQASLRLVEHREAQNLEQLLQAGLPGNFVSSSPNECVLVPISLPGQNALQNWQRVVAHVDASLEDLLGSKERQTGQRTGGMLMRALQPLGRVLLEVLLERLRIFTLNILNGPAPAGGNVLLIRQQRANGLGYLSDFLHALLLRLRAYQQAIQGAQEQRLSPEGPARQLMEALTRTRALGDSNPAPGIFGHGAQRLRQQYLDVAQELLEQGRVEQIESVVLELVAQFADEVERLCEQVQEWAVRLVGDSTSVVARAAEAQRVAEQQGRRGDILVQETIWDEAYNEKLYLYFGGAEPTLEQTRWWIGQLPGVDGAAALDLQWWGQSDSGYTRWAEAEQVHSGVHRTASEELRRVAEHANILDYLAEQDPRGPLGAEQVVERLWDNSRPALSIRQPGVLSSDLITPVANSRVEMDYIYRLQENATTRAAYNLLGVTHSQDSFRLTLIQWLDLVGISNVQSFVAAERDYFAIPSRYDYPNPARPDRLTREMLHVLPAEVHAVGIEARLPALNVSVRMAHRILRDEVVQQLEKPPRFKAFVDAWAWNVVQVLYRLGGVVLVEILGFLEPEDVVVETPRECDAQEFWLTEATPSFLEALWNWNYDCVNKHPKCRVRKGAGNWVWNFEALTRKIGVAQKEVVDSWLRENTEWPAVIPLEQKHHFDALAPDAQGRAAHWLATSRHLAERLLELEHRAHNLITQDMTAEQDAIAAMMVVLHEEIEMANQMWHHAIRG